MLNSTRYLELYLAVAWAAAIIVPLNVRWSVAENRDALEDCGARLLIVDDAFMEAGRSLAAAIPGLDLVHADEGEPLAGVARYESLLLRQRRSPTRWPAGTIRPASSTPAARPAARKGSR
jgi:long-chain acyl-CoA synthetase